MALEAWLNKNGESIYGTKASPLPMQSWGVSTLKGNKLYLHVFDWPSDGKLYVGGFVKISVTAYFLPNQKKLPVSTLNTTDFDINSL
jgi:alpha-L-fucosidase